MIDVKPAHAEFEKTVRDSFARQGLMGTIGAWMTDVEPGRVVIELPFSTRISQQHGLFHGAVIGALGDTAGGYAAMTLMPADSNVLTVEYKINFTRPAKGQLLRADGRVVHPGRTLSTVRVDVSAIDDGRSDVCAILQATMVRSGRA